MTEEKMHGFRSKVKNGKNLLGFGDFQKAIAIFLDSLVISS